MTKALVETTRKVSSYPSYYPAACFELFHATTASYIVAALQIVTAVHQFSPNEASSNSAKRLHSCLFVSACRHVISTAIIQTWLLFFKLFLLTIMGLTYYGLEKRGYLINVDAFRPVIACIATLHAGGALCAVIGVSSERKTLVNAHVTIVTALMVFTDIVAISIVLIMAIGNRIKFVADLPSYFVDERKFYDILGPFWMYLGAITLHITVAVNMCFLQVFNSFVSFLDEKMTTGSFSHSAKRAEIKGKGEEAGKNSS